MEKQLFDWDIEAGWDQGGTAMFQFYKCRLKVPIGIYDIGHVFPVIAIDYELGTIELYIDGEVKDNGTYTETILIGRYSLVLSVLKS